jgi:hypothetical protein
VKARNFAEGKRSLTPNRQSFDQIEEKFDSIRIRCGPMEPQKRQQKQRPGKISGPLATMRALGRPQTFDF